MMPVLWFGVALIAALVYSVRAQSRINPGVQLDWRWALVCVSSIVAGTCIALRTGVAVEGHAAFVIHTAALFVFSWLGLRFWSNRVVWRIGSPLLALTIAFAYTTDQYHWNNAIVLFAALAAVPAAMHLTRSWAYVAYLSLAVLDGYAVWGGDVMQRIELREQITFPSGLVLTQSVLPLLRPLSVHMSPTAIHVQQTVAWILVSLKQIGFMDIVLSCLAIALITRFSGFRSGLLASITLQVSVIAIGSVFIWRVLPVKDIPYLIILAPITVCFLAYSRR